jgi:hypothetical protein
MSLVNNFIHLPLLSFWLVQNQNGFFISHFLEKCGKISFPKAALNSQVCLAGILAPRKFLHFMLVSFRFPCCQTFQILNALCF